MFWNFLPIRWFFFFLWRGEVFAYFNFRHAWSQASYFPNPLAVELLPVDTIFQSWMRISVVTDYPIKTLLLESNQNFKIMMEVLVKICFCLQEMSISYNLLISDCGKKIFLFLQVKWPFVVILLSLSLFSSSCYRRNI